MRRSFFICILIFALFIVSACSKKQEESLVLEGHGKQWKANVDTELQLINGKNMFNITYTYLGSLEEINQAQSIVFAQGTSSGTQAVTVYDSKYKEELVENGTYQEEYEDVYGTLIEDLRNRKNTEFTISYYFQEDKANNTFEAMKDDKMNIQIQWKTSNQEYKDVIDMLGSR